MKLNALCIFAMTLLTGCATSAPHPVSQEGRSKGSAYLFVGVDCPISNSYAPELNRIITDYSGRGIAFFLVYPDAAVTSQQAAEHSRAFGYNCIILLDSDHSLAKRLGVTVTVEAAVLAADGTLQYRGRIDDLYESFGKKRFAATTHELRDTLDAIVTDRHIKPTTTLAVGCNIN